jgi:hypothetical protein
MGSLLLLLLTLTAAANPRLGRPAAVLSAAETRQHPGANPSTTETRRPQNESQTDYDDDESDYGVYKVYEEDEDEYDGYEDDEEEEEYEVVEDEIEYDDEVTTANSRRPTGADNEYDDD